MIRIAELRRALKDGEIVPYFQPQVQIRTGQIAGFEVLARWRHPVRGMVPPDEFIPVAEKVGLIGELTEAMLSQAFAARATHSQDWNLSVNVSPLQLRDDSLPALIRRVAKRSDFPLDHLTIEITESALLDNLEQAGTIADELKSMGVHLSLDDFGTGYSSLRHLRALPFDEIKVDRSFVSSMLDNRDSRKIVAAVVGLGQSLKLTTVAEGIESTAQAKMLLWLGCEVGQGWLYGRAVPVEDLPAVLAKKMPTGSDAYPGTGDPDLTAWIEPLASHRLAQCQAIYDGAPVGLSFLDTNLRYVSINQRLADMNGLRVEEHIGRKMSEIVSPEIYATFEAYLLRALRGEAFAGLESTWKSTTRLVSLQPARDEAGEIIGISSVIMDISERKRVEEALRDSEDRYRYMFQLTPQIPWIMRPDGMNIEVGPGWEAITGQTPAEAANDGWLIPVHPKDLEDVAPMIQFSLRTGDPIDIEYRILTRDGTWLWMRSRGKARRDQDGQIIQWYGSVEDIDDRKKTKLALEEAEAKLASLLVER